MDNRTQANSDSELFTVRLWRTETGHSDPTPSIYGKIQHVLSGAAHSFDDWTALIRFMETMLPNPGNLSQPSEQITRQAVEEV